MKRCASRSSSHKNSYSKYNSKAELRKTQDTPIDEESDFGQINRIRYQSQTQKYDECTIDDLEMRNNETPHERGKSHESHKVNLLSQVISASNKSRDRISYVER